MSLLGIIESLRRNLKTVVVASCVVLALVVVADVVRLMTAGEHEAATPEHVAAGEPAVASEHAAPAHGESAEASHGFWASTYHIAENVPGFWTLFGFLGCVVLVVVSKSYGHLWVSKREDYYGE
jgi:hypothetical protein